MGLMSTLDSALSASSTIWGHDFSANYSKKIAQLGMVVTTVIATVIAFIPGITILYLLFFYGTSRAATMMPTILTLTNSKINEKITDTGMFYGVLAGLILGAPVTIYGQINKIWQISLTGSLCAIGLSAAIVLITRRKN